MFTVEIPGAHVQAFLKERCLFEKHFKGTLNSDGATNPCSTVETMSFRVQVRQARVLKRVLRAFTERTFSSQNVGNIGEAERWRLMKRYGVYVQNCFKTETHVVYSCQADTLKSAGCACMAQRVECITLGDAISQPTKSTSQGAEEEVVPAQTSSAADESVIFLGSFPGPPPKRRKGQPEQKETVEGLGLPYDSEEYAIHRRIPVAIAIDGSNVAREHGLADETYSCRGIQIAVDFFEALGHFPIRAFVPRYIRDRQSTCKVPVKNPEVLDSLVAQNRLTFTPSREELNGRMTVPYDDRFILNYAHAHGAVVLSNDRYRDIACESAAFAFLANRRLLMFSFAGDLLMIPSDPKGRFGPSLLYFLSHPMRQFDPSMAKMHRTCPAPPRRRVPPRMDVSIKRLNGSRALTHVRRRQQRRRKSGRYFDHTSR